MTPSVTEQLSHSKLYDQLISTYTQVFQVVDIPADKATDLAKDFIHETIRRSTIRLCENENPHQTEVLDFLETNPDTDNLMSFIADKFTQEEFAKCLAQGYTEIFGSWFQAIATDLPEVKKQQILSIIQDYQAQQA